VEKKQYEHMNILSCVRFQEEHEIIVGGEVGPESGEEEGGEEKVDPPRHQSSGVYHRQDLELYASIQLSDYPQAFSHFSYTESRRKLLVCDLQGVLDKATKPFNTYRLTDPCIHTTERHHRRYGRTDHREKGVSKFFQTHSCNAVCRLLGLPNDETESRGVYVARNY
jgi:hypothetical protein